jgi:hypothetical protein
MEHAETGRWHFRNPDIYMSNMLTSRQPISHEGLHCTFELDPNLVQPAGLS